MSDEKQVRGLNVREDGGTIVKVLAVSTRNGEHTYYETYLFLDDVIAFMECCLDDPSDPDKVIRYEKMTRVSTPFTDVNLAITHEEFAKLMVAHVAKREVVDATPSEFKRMGREAFLEAVGDETTVS